MTTNSSPDHLVYAPYQTRASNGGTQERYRFANGYGASLIIGGMAYGGLELAVVGPDGKLCYDTPITSDVLGSLISDEVQPLLAAIAALPAVTA